MFEIDKAKFGAFVAQLRKEKGLMQKELAEKLYVSDKAVSKWERGLSIPDVAILVPLADILGVTVTELLECRRLPKDEPMGSQQTEEIVKKVICLSEEEQRIVTLHVQWGYKHRELAQILGCPTGTVTSKYKRAIEKLRKALKEEEQ